MASSSEIGSVATFNIIINGSMVSHDFSILRLRIEKKVNRISSARISILDGDPNSQTFNASSSSIFVPGNKIVIQAGYDGNDQIVFKGIITGQSIIIDGNVGSMLEVECRDESVKMIVGRKSKSFTNKKDSEIISSILESYSGISTNVTLTTSTIPEQLQYYVTDWDFIVSLAESNGLVVTTVDNTVSVFKPDTNTSPLLTAAYGDNLLEFDAKLNAISQTDTIKASAWDYKTQTVIETKAKNNYEGPGNLSSKKLSEVVGLSEYQLATPAPIGTDALTTWSNVQMLKSEFAKIQGNASIHGTSLVNPGKYITLAGLGDRFNGDYFISGVEHTISDGNWITSVNLGLPATWFIEQPDVMAPPASGLLPGISGLFTGTVTKMCQDPDSQYRVQVNVSLIDENTQIWARLANFYATAGAGAFFYPEVGDEVIIGFINEDPRFPVVLGSLYSNSSKPPYSTLTPTDTNALKAIVSKSGISVQFDDENKELKISTPGRNSVTLSDQDKKVSLADQNGNSIIMSEEGITITSDKNININAGQNINFNGALGVKTISTDGDVLVRGLNIKEVAAMQYSAEGSMAAKVTAGMELTLKGAMVNIN